VTQGARSRRWGHHVVRRGKLGSWWRSGVIAQIEHKPERWSARRFWAFIPFAMGLAYFWISQLIRATLQAQ